MVAAVWSVFLRGAVLENHEEIPARTSTIRDCVDPRLSAALPFMTTIDQSSAVNKSGHSETTELNNKADLFFGRVTWLPSPPRVTERPSDIGMFGKTQPCGEP